MRKESRPRLKRLKKTKPPEVSLGALTGAGDEIRTHDFNLGKVALYP